MRASKREGTMTQGPNSTGGSSFNPQGTDRPTTAPNTPNLAPTSGTPGAPPTQTSPTHPIGSNAPQGDIGDQVQQTASHIADRAGDVVSSQLTAQKTRAVNGLGSVADALRRTSQGIAQSDAAGIHQ